MRLTEAINIKKARLREKLKSYTMNTDKLIVMPSFQIVSDREQMNNIHAVAGDMVMNSETGEIFVYERDCQWTKIIGGDTSEISYSQQRPHVMSFPPQGLR